MKQIEQTELTKALQGEQEILVFSAIAKPILYRLGNSSPVYITYIAGLLCVCLGCRLKEINSKFLAWRLNTLCKEIF